MAEPPEHLEPDDDTVVVQPRPGIKVYDNPHGMIVIRNFGTDDDDPYVLVHPEDAEQVARAILDVAATLVEERPEIHRPRT